MTDYIVPVLLFLAAALALGKRENAYDLLLQGGADGLKLLVTILPAVWVTSFCSAGLGVTAAWVLGKVWRE